MTRDSIFISYRRDDAAGHVGRLYDKLSVHFPSYEIFMDVDGIEPGEDFLETIDQAIASSRVLLVIIGQKWLSCTDGKQRRLDDPNDFVRLEIAAALDRNIRIIPVLVQEARMPTEAELPDNLARLAHRQAQEIGDGYRWKSDVEALIRALEKVFSVQAQERVLSKDQASERHAAKDRQSPANQTRPIADAKPPAKDLRQRLPIESMPNRNYRRIVLVGACALAFIIGIITLWLLKPHPKGNVTSTDAAAVIVALKNAHKPIGIDVQDHRGNINWITVKNSDISFAYIKASDGIGFRDERFQANWKASKAASVLRGAYTVFRPEQNPDQQAQVFVEAVQAGQMGFGDLPPAVAVKDFPVQEKSTEDLLTMLHAINQRFARTPVIYTSMEFWKPYSRSGDFAKYLLWVTETHVSQPSTLPSGWPAWTFWQFSQSSTVPGISGPVDLNTYNGSLEQLLAYSRGEVSP
jgi:GH25 family lysozyme M1 (1,4-beta-N-acetylmuramidase)